MADFSPPSGVNDEAPFNLLKSIPSSYWHSAASYPAFISELAALEAARVRQAALTRTTTTASESEHDTRLRFHAFFATSDMMIGEGGRVYFDSLFEDEVVKASVLYMSEVIPDSNHESIVGAAKGAIEKVFEEVRAGWEDGLV